MKSFHFLTTVFFVTPLNDLFTVPFPLFPSVDAVFISLTENYFRTYKVTPPFLLISLHYDY